MAGQAGNPSYYPAFLDLRGKLVVVVGGGEVALRKVESLIAAAASVRVVAPEVHPEIEALESDGVVRLERRPYLAGDLEGAALAIAATSDQEVNRQVSGEAADRGIFLNVVDVPSYSSFIVPSVVRRDELTLAISTGGLSPALAKRIREKLEESLAPEYGLFLRLLGGMRSRIRRELPLAELREMFWTEVVNSDAFELFQSGGEAAARSRIDEILDRIREGQPWIVVVGLNHRLAPVEIRERFAIRDDDLATVLDGLANIARERVVLSTCNRLEVYAVSERSRHVADDLIRYLRDSLSLDSSESSLRPYFFDFHNQAAARHLFSVASGIDSMIVGEPQILGQVKDAYETAAACRAVGPVLNALFQQGLSVGKRARTETGIARSAASISHVAVELSRQLFGEIASRTVLVVGAGEMGEVTAKNLVDNGAGRILVANRTQQRAESLADRFGGVSVPWDSLESALVEADVVITSTGACDPVFRMDSVVAAMKERDTRPLVFVDMAVPRDVDPAVRSVENVRLYDIDDLQAVVASNLQEREKEVAAVLSIVDEEVSGFVSRLRCLEVVPTISALREKAESIRQAEVARYAGRMSLSDRDRNVLVALTQGIVNKILHTPTVRLKAQASDGACGLYVDAVKELFDLDGGEPSSQAGQAPEGRG